MHACTFTLLQGLSAIPVQALPTLRGTHLAAYAWQSVHLPEGTAGAGCMDTVHEDVSDCVQSIQHRVDLLCLQHLLGAYKFSREGPAGLRRPRQGLLPIPANSTMLIFLQNISIVLFAFEVRQGQKKRLEPSASEETALSAPVERVSNTS